MKLDVQKGQVWRSSDPRFPDDPTRFLVVDFHYYPYQKDDRVTVRVLSGPQEGRMKQLLLRRFNGNSNGYRLLKEGET